MSLTALLQQLSTIRYPIVNNRGELDPRFQRFLHEFIDNTGDAEQAAAAAQTAADAAQTSADTAQTAATTAQNTAAAAQSTSVYDVVTPKNVQWFGDTVPAGDPTRDITFEFKDKDDATIATRVLRGTLTSSSGTISVAVQGTPSGLTTAHSLTNDGTANVRADVTVTLSDGSKRTATAGWTYVDTSTVGEVYY